MNFQNSNNNRADSISSSRATQSNHEHFGDYDLSQTQQPGIEIHPSQVSQNVIRDNENDEFDLPFNLSSLISESDSIKCEIFENELIGEGAFGQVFKGLLKVQMVNDNPTINQVAVKRTQITDLRDSDIKQMAELEHPNVIGTYYIFVDNSFVYQSMELCRGSLSKFMKLKKFGLKEIHKVDFLLQISRGMNYIHEKNIVHRDLKPDNVVLNMFPETIKDLTKVVCKIIDLSSDGGTINYMSYEAACFGNFSPKSDVYAFGVLIWELLTEQQPFEGLTPEQIRIKLYNRIEDNLPIAEKMKDKDLAKLMRNTWSRNADKRPTFANIITILENIKKL